MMTVFPEQCQNKTIFECVPIIHRTHFNLFGFSLGAKVDTSYESSDTSKMSSVTKDTLIRPNVQSDDVTKLVKALDLLSNGKPTTETYQTISTSAQRILSGDKQDPIKAVVVPLASINKVTALFVDSPDNEVDCSDFVLFAHYDIR